MFIFYFISSHLFYFLEYCIYEVKKKPHRKTKIWQNDRVLELFGGKWSLAHPLIRRGKREWTQSPFWKPFSFGSILMLVDCSRITMIPLTDRLGTEWSSEPENNLKNMLSVCSYLISAKLNTQDSVAVLQTAFSTVIHKIMMLQFPS